MLASHSTLRLADVSVKLTMPQRGFRIAMRLAIFSDQLYAFDGKAFSTDETYVLFPLSFTVCFEQLVFLGRLHRKAERKPYVLPQPGTAFCELPYYEKLCDLWRLGRRIYPEVRRIIRENAFSWDAVWLCGPNPLSIVIAEECDRLGVPFFLVIRQNLTDQMKFGSRGIRRILLTAAARRLEKRFRTLAQDRTVFLVGAELADFYRRATRKVHVHFSASISREELQRPCSSLRSREPNRLLAVGRLSSEKGFHHLLDALAILSCRDVDWVLDLIGKGCEEPALRRQASALGLTDRVRFHGYVPFGPKLHSFFDQARVFVLPSLPGEGFPQVLCQAFTYGVPSIATTVAGIPHVIRDRLEALLVPPGDPSALAQAIELLLRSTQLQEQLQLNGRTWMRNFTIEVQRERTFEIIQREVLRNPCGGVCQQDGS
jgi:glycosyltransferase involved in cell wall biosynthesis